MHTCGDPSAERLALCLHGFPEHAISWRHQMPKLAELGYRVWAPNLRGYGRTTRPTRVSEYHIDHLLSDVAALIDRAEAKSVTLLGHDWGGIVAWRFALDAVRPLERLVVMNLPHPTRFAEALRRNPRQMLRSFYEPIFRLPGGVAERLLGRKRARAVGELLRTQVRHPHLFPAEIVEVYRAQAAEPGALTAMLNWYRANPFRVVNAGTFPILETPTLMIWGVHDQALGKEMTIGTERLVRDFTLRYLDASHWVQQDAPQQTNEILEAWLRGRPVPTFL